MIPLSAITILLTIAPDWCQPTLVHASAKRALPLLQQAAAVHIEKKTCFGCHNQNAPAAAVKLSTSRGFTAPDDFFVAQREHITDFIAGNIKQFQSGAGTGGGVDTAGTILMALESHDHKADANTDAIITYLLKARAKEAFWKCSSNRPPTEASSITTTYLAMRGLKTWANAEQKPSAEKRILAAGEWLTEAKAKDTEDAVFRLSGLHLAGASTKTIAEAGKELLTLQRADGGWGQMPKMPSDAYTTGTALVALQETGQLTTTSAAYRRGMIYLMNAQLADGSWKVPSRSKPFQKYYESGFPHEKDQFISAPASGWATQALLLALPKKVE